MANALSDITTDAGALEVFLNLNSKERTKLREVIEGIATRIKEFARKLTGVESRILIKDADVLKKFAKELSAQLDTAGKQAQNNTAQGGVKFSIETTLSGEKYVYIDPLSIDVNNGLSVAKNLALLVKNKFDNLIFTNGQYIRINARTNKEFTGSDWALALKSENIKWYNDKIQSLYHADELLQIAKNWKNENIKHNRKDKITSFGRGEILYKVGNSGYSADILVALKDDGSAILYDIIKINNKKIADTNSVGEGDSLSSTDVSATDTISNFGIDVKKNSFADEEYLAVVEREDMEAAQALVDEAAERKFRNSKARDMDGKLIKVYHGTESDVFYEFDKNRRGQKNSALSSISA